jgi:hypothetical protein
MRGQLARYRSYYSDQAAYVFPDIGAFANTNLGFMA